MKRPIIPYLVSVLPASGSFVVFGPDYTGFAWVEPVHAFGVLDLPSGMGRTLLDSRAEGMAVVPLVCMDAQGLEDPTGDEACLGCFDEHGAIDKLNELAAQGIVINASTRVRFGERIERTKETPEEAEERRKNLNR